MKIPKITPVTLKEMSELSDNELKNLTWATTKEKEIYHMEKFIDIFQLYQCGSKAECFRQINEYRQEKGYPLWKSIGSLVRLWDMPFKCLDITPEMKSWIDEMTYDQGSRKLNKKMEEY